MRIIYRGMAIAPAALGLAGSALVAPVETVLYSFCSQPGCSDGWGAAGLIADNQGALFGTAAFGGRSEFGTVFKLTPPSSGQAACLLYSFTGGSDGSVPIGGVIADKEGALYGTTNAGGTAAGDYGTVFKLTPPPPAAVDQAVAQSSN